MRSTNPSLLILGVSTAALAGAGLLVYQLAGGGRPAGATGPPPRPAPDTAEARGVHQPIPAAASATVRDVARDRIATGSAAAWSAYTDGVSLQHRLPVQAAARFRRAVSLDPQFAPARYRLAVSALLSSQEKAARAAIAEALADQERLPEPYLSAAEPLAHLIDGAFDLTDRSVRTALSAHPGDPDLHLIAGMLAACSCDHFDPARVIEHLELVVSAHPDFPAARDRLLEAYEMKGMREWALSRAIEHQSRHPDRADVLAEVAQARIARGEYGDAIEAADDIVRRGGDVLGLGLGPAFILSGQHGPLASMYDPEMERTNGVEQNLLTHLHAGINDVWLGRFERAARHFDRGPEFAPSAWEKSRRARFLLLLGRLHWLEGRHREAGAALRSAIDEGGPEGVLEYALGMNHLAAGEPDLASRAAYRLGQERHESRPGWTEPWRLLLVGEVALAAGDVAPAIEQFRSAWRLESPLAIDCIAGHSDAYFLDALGRAHLAGGRHGEALAAFDQILALGIRGLHQPEIVVPALYRSALALEALGRRPAAAERLRRFVRLWGSAQPASPMVRDATRRLEALTTGR